MMAEDITGTKYNDLSSPLKRIGPLSAPATIKAMTVMLGTNIVVYTVVIRSEFQKFLSVRSFW